MEHSELIKRAAKWLTPKYGVVLTEYHCWTTEIPDVLGFRNRESILIECKVSRSDFFHDQKKAGRNNGARHFGNKRYYLVPDGMVAPNEIPSGWGLLYAKKNSFKKVIAAPWHSEAEIKVEEYNILYSLARRATIRGYLQDLTKPLENRAIEPKTT
jgi:hypothetical protein